VTHFFTHMWYYAIAARAGRSNFCECCLLYYYIVLRVKFYVTPITTPRLCFTTNIIIVVIIVIVIIQSRRGHMYVMCVRVNWVVLSTKLLWFVINTNRGWQSSIKILLFSGMWYTFVSRKSKSKHRVSRNVGSPRQPSADLPTF